MADNFARLTDDLLLHILQFVPAKEGAFTTTLSKRWRHLWRTSGAVNLRALILEEEEAPLNAKRDRFVAQALKVLDGFVEAGPLFPLKKLTIVVEARNRQILRRFLDPDLDAFPDGVLPRVLAHQVVRTVHELRIQAIDNVPGEPMLFEKDLFEPDQASFGPPIYNLRLSHLPRQALRVLDLSDCGDLAPGLDFVVFPQLHSIRLNHCTITPQNLDKIARAAPSLTTVRLEFTLLLDGGAGTVLVFPAATSLLIYMCCITVQATLEINAPMLQEFVYKGISRNISLLPPPEGLLRVGLDQIYFRGKETRNLMSVCSNFWNFLRGCIHARRLNLTVWSLDVLAQTSPVLELMHVDSVELTAVYWPSSKMADVSIANLLRCCPALRKLRINLTTDKETHLTEMQVTRSYLAQKFKADYEESLEMFRRYEIGQPVAAREDSEDSVSSKRPRMQPDLMFHELDGLTGQDFKCLETSLASVALQFRQGEKCPFGVNLVMFFAQHGKVLEEILLDAGNARLHEHLNVKIDKWLAGQSGRKIQILPAERREKAGGH
ncbi:hypothetical protein ACQ4PT_033525 [Festuca glaucescens]